MECSLYNVNLLAVGLGVEGEKDNSEQKHARGVNLRA